jgi:dihydrofolate reductase
VEFLSLDGVMQAPGSPQEDPSGGFRYGGWAAPYSDPVIGEVAAAGMKSTDAYLFGRITYDGMVMYWPNTPADDPMGSQLNAAPKYVASRSRPTLTWEGAELLEGDAVDAVADLKAQEGGSICVLGSGELVRTLLGAGLVDQMLLTIHPVVLGTGKRLFGNSDAPLGMELVDSQTTTKGSVMLTYRPS